jgi:ribonuclease E
MSPWEEEARYAGSSSRNAVVATAEPPTFEAEDSAPVREERGERPERGERRGRGRRERFPAEPPEFVHVEMTADEQSVYSWMGISPLVLTDQVVKNPRNAYIAVTLPGEVPPEPPTTLADDGEDDSRPRSRPTLVKAVSDDRASHAEDEVAMAIAAVDDAAIAAEVDEDEPSPRRLVRRRNQNANDASLLTQVTVKPLQDRLEPSETAASDDDTSLEEESDEAEVPVVRRRRRRSSAKV